MSPGHALEALLVLARERGITLNRTRAAKLLFFADYRAVQRGRPAFTGLTWTWVDYGPFDKAAWYEAERELVHAGVMTLHKEPVGADIDETVYTVSAAAALSGADDCLADIDAVLAEYGSLTASEIRRLAYQTPPMLAAQAAGERPQPLDLTITRKGASPIEQAIAMGPDRGFSGHDTDLPRWKRRPSGPRLLTEPLLPRT